jgi:hypothetical protein
MQRSEMKNLVVRNEESVCQERNCKFRSAAGLLAELQIPLRAAFQLSLYPHRSALWAGNIFTNKWLNGFMASVLFITLRCHNEVCIQN